MNRAGLSLAICDEWCVSFLHQVGGVSVSRGGGRTDWPQKTEEETNSQRLREWRCTIKCSISNETIMIFTSSTNAFTGSQTDCVTTSQLVPGVYTYITIYKRDENSCFHSSNCLTAVSHVFQVAGCHAAPVGFCPSLSWQQQQVGCFSDVRQVKRKKQILSVLFIFKTNKKLYPMYISPLLSSQQAEVILS